MDGPERRRRRHIFHSEGLMPKRYSRGGRCSWARIIILVGEGLACAQGYNLNCKKIKQFLISFIAIALRFLFTFIFISATSYPAILFIFPCSHDLSACVFSPGDNDLGCILYPPPPLLLQRVKLLPRKSSDRPRRRSKHGNQMQNLAEGLSVSFVMGLWFYRTLLFPERNGSEL